MDLKKSRAARHGLGSGSVRRRCARDESLRGGKARLLVALVAIAMAATVALQALPILPVAIPSALGMQTGAYGQSGQSESAEEIAAQASRWGALSTEERIACIRSVVCREAEKLELESVPHVIVGPLAPDVRGCYTEDVITVNGSLLATELDGWAMVGTAAHETYHDFQREAVDGCLGADDVDSATIEAWRAELADYVESGEGYYDQLVESTARDYASKAVEAIRLEAACGEAAEI